jgi:hypothetical protein
MAGMTPVDKIPGYIVARIQLGMIVEESLWMIKV